MSWHELNDEEKRQVEERFSSLSQRDIVRRNLQDEDRAQRFGFGDVYQFATNATYEMNDGLKLALRQNEKLQEALDQLLSSHVIYQFPRAAAASSGALDRREGDGFSILIKESRAQAGQVYIIIKMDNAFETEPTALTVKTEAGDYLKKGLPLGVDGVIQILAEDKEDFVIALRDAASEVFLS